MDRPERVCAPETKVEISLWRNADQNENQGTHEIEILQTIMSTAQVLQKEQTNVLLSDLVAKAGKRTTHKISPLIMRIVAEFFIQYLNKDQANLLLEMVEFHCLMVNPRELVVAAEFFKNLNREASLVGAPFLNMYILFSQYTKEKTIQRTNGPSTAQFLEAGSINNLCKRPDLVESLEKMIEDLRHKALPVLQKAMQVPMARLQVAVLWT